MEEEKKGFKTWFVEKKEQVKTYFKEHPDTVLTIISIGASILGGAMKIYASKSEYDGNLFTEVDGDIYKIPAKQMKTAKYLQKTED